MEDLGVQGRKSVKLVTFEIDELLGRFEDLKGDIKATILLAEDEWRWNNAIDKWFQ